MKIGDLFDIRYGVNLELNKLDIVPDDTDEPYVNFVARTSMNNGVVAKVKLLDGVLPNPAGSLSCAAGGSVLSTFIQNEPYYSGRDLYVLVPKKPMGIVEKLFYCYVIELNRYRYNYGRQANKTLMDINIPASIPSWVYDIDLDKYHNLLITQDRPNNAPLNTNNWRDFKLIDLFNVSKGTRIVKEDRIEGDIPLVTAGMLNLGGKEHISNSEQEIFSKSITIDMFCNSHTHFNKFCCDDNVIVLTAKDNLSVFSMLFVNTVIKQDEFKYQYGRQYRLKNLQNHVIKLPATPKGKPDWLFMDNYIKALPYADKMSNNLT